MLLPLLEMACQNFLLVTELWTGGQAASGVCPFVLNISARAEKVAKFTEFLQEEEKLLEWGSSRNEKRKKSMSPALKTHINTHTHTHTQTKWPLFGYE